MQLKMFLTRLGPNAKCIITGDLSQIDLPRRMKSGLVEGLDILGDIEGIAKVFLTTDDVVRHRLVKAIIKAYDRNKSVEKDINSSHTKKTTQDGHSEDPISGQPENGSNTP